jgi:hypothetical protein
MSLDFENASSRAVVEWKHPSVRPPNAAVPSSRSPILPIAAVSAAALATVWAMPFFAASLAKINPEHADLKPAAVAANPPDSEAPSVIAAPPRAVASATPAPRPETRPRGASYDTAPPPPEAVAALAPVAVVPLPVIAPARPVLIERPAAVMPARPAVRPVRVIRAAPAPVAPRETEREFEPEPRAMRPFAAASRGFAPMRPALPMRGFGGGFNRGLFGGFGRALLGFGFGRR